MRELEAKRTSLGAPVILTTNEERDVWTRASWMRLRRYCDRCGMRHLRSWCEARTRKIGQQH